MLNKACVLVCVTVQKDCDRLIKTGREQAKALHLPLHVLHVSRDQTLLGKENTVQVLDYLFQLAHEMEAEMNIRYADNALETIRDYVVENNVSHIVLGTSNNHYQPISATDTLKTMLTEVEFIICPVE